MMDTRCNRSNHLVALALCAIASSLSACKTGIFDNEDSKWRADDAQLKRIDALDPAGISLHAPVSLEDAAKKSLDEITIPEIAKDPVALSLVDVRCAVLTNNLEMRTALVDPAIAQEAVSVEEAKFESAFFTSYRRNDNSLFADLATGAAANSDSFDAGFTVPLATGGEIVVSSPLTRSANGASFGGTDDDWLASMSFSMSQPLLRGAGVNANTNSIRVAQWQGQIADSRTKLEAIRILSNSDQAYWNLYSAFRELGVRRSQYDVALKQLERARRRVVQGEAAEIEVVRAESGVGRTLEQIIVADSNLRIRQRALKRLMNRDDLPVTSSTPLKPATDPNPLGLTLDGVKLSEQAVVNRMEMLELELQLAIDSSDVDFSKNAALPLFVVDYGYNAQGTGTDASGAYGAIGNNDSFNIGLRAEIPLGNEAAESRVRAAILQRVQRLATREARKQAIRTEVFDALDALTQSWQRILAARLESVLAARTLAAEERQFDVGLRTSTDVLDASASLADAQSREVLALASYQIALVDIAFATGTSLGAAHIRWEPISKEEIDRLETAKSASELGKQGATIEQGVGPVPSASEPPSADQ